MYDLILLTDWNWPHADPGRGSAIFIHQWRRPGADPTAWLRAPCRPPRPARGSPRRIPHQTRLIVSRVRFPFPNRFGRPNLRAQKGRTTMARTPSASDDEIFDLRLARSAPDLFPMLEALYGRAPRLSRLSRQAGQGSAQGLEGPPGRPEAPGPAARSGTRLVPAPRHGGLCLLHRPLQRHAAGHPGQAGLP